MTRACETSRLLNKVESGRVDHRFEAFGRLIEAGLEVPQSTDQKIALLKRRIRTMKAFDEHLDVLKSSGAFGVDEPGGIKLSTHLYQIRYKRMGAEMDLLKETLP